MESKKIENLENSRNMKKILKNEKKSLSKKIITNLVNLESFTISFWIKKSELIDKKLKNKKVQILSLKQGNKNMISILGYKNKLIFNIA